MKEIYVKKKNVYGNELVYPDCETSILLSNLMPTKTFSPDDIRTLKQLGYKLKTKSEDL
jgi:hypothetical protein